MSEPRNSFDLTAVTRLARGRVHLFRALRFFARVVGRFWRNKGLLIAGGVAYNALLSLVPLLALVLIALTFFVSRGEALSIVEAELLLITGPEQAAELSGAFTTFLDNRELVGGIGFVVLLFFSSLAFRMLEDAFAVIFAHRTVLAKRKAWVSALLPYAFAAVIGLALVALTTVTVTIERLSPHLDELSSSLLYLAGFVGQVVLFAAFYRVLPASHVSFRRALIGSLVATVLWEITRSVMTWYLANLSLVSIIYGSFTTVIVILLSLEVATIIVLLGAQVIAELEHSAEAGVRWYVDADAVAANAEAQLEADGDVPDALILPDPTAERSPLIDEPSDSRH